MVKCFFRNLCLWQELEDERDGEEAADGVALEGPAQAEELDLPRKYFKNEEAHQIPA